ncbi:hypothetical protein [Wolbachia endosymbiont of Ctenocephalides felis wCfeT]|uniref:hypothetical protein n=1 Tax=Wolbachia endosymbiont of Ctenocephalides felis wCfeT TaxID=2732593 RepID=UPI001445D0CB|nr:hypothetical protein [Wolbachia endosymbiont of Ctenocephalides felis wCfeT]
MTDAMVNALIERVEGFGYYDLNVKKISESGWKKIISGEQTNEDIFDRSERIYVNRQKITRKFINDLKSTHENLISKDENGKKDYRPFLREAFTEIFKNTGAAVPNDFIIAKLIDNYHQGGYINFFCAAYFEVLFSFNLHSDFYKRKFHISCDDPNCLKFSFSSKIGIHETNDTGRPVRKICNLSSSVEFTLRCKDGNVEYEEGKVLLIIPKKLENYEQNGKSLKDIIIEYFQRFCEIFGFILGIKIEHDLDTLTTKVNGVVLSSNNNKNQEESKSVS